ncbi:hypothetical protein AHF37_12236 [Paragonimus kellicotti]|nr:hypothetical protein AHF37_12236 [Paragonimus kellicotti]
MLVAVLLVRLLVVYGAEDVNNGLKTFSVQPGGNSYSESISRYGVECKFTYSCQGGTNEVWQMTLFKIRDDVNFGCRVERAGEGRSYLLFQSFILQAVPSDGLLTGSAWGNGKQPLSPEDYKIDKRLGSVSNKGGKFGHELNGLSLEFTTVVDNGEL